MRGAPLRFAAAVIGGWAAGRIVALSPVPLPDVAPRVAPLRAAEPVASARPPTVPAGSPSSPIAVRREPFRAVEVQSARATRYGTGSRVVVMSLRRPPLVTDASEPPREDEVARSITPPLPPGPLTLRASDRRLAIDAWLVARPSGGNSLAFGQLGASQSGARLTYALDRERRIALSARIAAPLKGKGREAGLGIDVRPSAAPVHLLFEQRFAIDGGVARPAVTIISGGSSMLPGKVRLDAYGQGGAVWKRGGFADGAALAVRPMLERSAVRVELGAGAWGAAQRRVSRLDVGPSAAMVASIGGRAMRLQVDYRLRVAGNARPGTGPALTLGGSF